MNIKGFKAKDGTVHKYDFNELANLPETPEGEQGADGGYYTPAVTQPTADTIQFDFTPSKAGMPSVKPVQVTLPSQDSGGNADQSGLSTTAANLLVTILREGVYNSDQSANITALAAELAVTEEEEPDTPVEPDEPVTPEKTLSSISATYSGGDVAVGTAVTALTGIVVTAHYSDGTSETVTGYTLSGTIAEGSNTVTVSYGGKTTTFVVTGVDEAGGGETTGGTVEMMGEVSANETSFTAYSDGGTTSAKLKLSGGGGAFASAEIFEEDTKVKITIEAVSGKPYIGHSFASTDWDGVNTNKSLGNAYYAEDLPGGGWTQSPATFEYEYTVRAGYRLLIANYFLGTDNSVSITVEKVVA